MLKIRRMALIKNPTKARLTKANFKLLIRYHEIQETRSNKPARPAISMVRNKNIFSTSFTVE